MGLSIWPYYYSPGGRGRLERSSKRWPNSLFGASVYEFAANPTFCVLSFGFLEFGQIQLGEGGHVHWVADEGTFKTHSIAAG